MADSCRSCGGTTFISSKKKKVCGNCGTLFLKEKHGLPTNVGYVEEVTDSFFDMIEEQKNADLETTKPLQQKTFGRYTIIKMIGEGGMGKVYKAHDPELGRSVALKVMTSDNLETGKKRFLREAKAMAKLRHPNIVTIHDIGGEETLFFTMDYIRGGSLKELLESSSLTISEVVKIMIKIGKAIHYAHKGGVIHRDLKPANILIDKKKDPKVVDFGLAKLIEDNNTALSESGMLLGTLMYMSPEQAQGNIKAIDKRSDVYSLGAILYELLTGSPPFTGQNHLKILHNMATKKVTPPTKLNANVPEKLEKICMKALAKKKEFRYQTAKAMVEELALFAGSISKSERNQPIRLASSPKYSRKSISQKKQTAKSKKNYTILIPLLIVILGLIATISFAFPDSEAPIKDVEETNDKDFQSDKVAKQNKIIPPSKKQPNDEKPYNGLLVKDNPTRAQDKEKSLDIAKPREIEKPKVKETPQIKKIDPKAQKEWRDKWDQFLKAQLPKLVTSRKFKQLFSQIQELQILARQVKMPSITLDEINATKNDIEQVEKVIIVAYRDALKMIKESKRRKKTVGVALVDGKFLRGTVQQISKRQFTLKNYKNKSHTISFRQIKTTRLIQFLSAGNAKNKKIQYYLALVCYYDENLKWAERLARDAKKQQYKKAAMLLTKIIEKQQRLIYKKAAIVFSEPQQLNSKKSIKVTSSIWQLKFTGTVQASKAVDKVYLQGQEIDWDSQKKTFSGSAQLSYGKNTIELTIVSSHKKAKHSWEVIRQKALNLPIFRGSLQLTGQYFTADIKKYHGLKWSFAAPREVTVTPTIEGNVIYVAGFSSMVYGLDKVTGKKVWEFQIGNGTKGNLAIDNGVMFMLSNSGYLYAIDIKKRIKLWEFKARRNMFSSPTVHKGVVYFGSMDHYFYAINVKTGKELWKYRAQDRVTSGCAIAEGVIYFGSHNGQYYGVNIKTGQLLRTYTTKDQDSNTHTVSSPAVVNGVLYVGGRDSFFYAFAVKTGKELWKYKTDGAIHCSPAIKNGIVYFGNKGQHVYALNAKTGKLVWQFKARGSIHASPITTKETLYIASTYRLYAFDLKNGNKKWEYNSKKNTYWAGPIVADGIVYFGAGNYLYALH